MSTDNLKRMALFEDVRVREKEVEQALRRYGRVTRAIVQNPGEVSTDAISLWENDTDKLMSDLREAMSRLEEANHNILGYFRPDDLEAPCHDP